MNKDISQKVHAISGGLRQGMAVGAYITAYKENNSRKQLIEEYNQKLIEMQTLNREVHELADKIFAMECDADTDCSNCPFFQGYEHIYPMTTFCRHATTIKKCSLNKEGFIVVKRPNISEEEI